MSDQAESIDLPCTLESKNQQIPSVVTIDFGANGSLIDPKFVYRNKLPIAKSVRNLVRDPSEYLCLGMTEYPSPGFLGVFGSYAVGVAGEY